MKMTALAIKIGAKGLILMPKVYHFKKLIFLLAFAAFAQYPLQVAPYQLIDGRNGAAKACSGCFIYTYLAGTTSAQATYTSSTLGVALPNPVRTNTAGYAISGSNAITGIWVNGNSCYHIVFKDAAAVTIWDQDNLCNPAALVTNLRALLATSAGAGMIGFSQSSTYAAATVGKKLQQFINVTDAPFNASAGSSDNTGAFTAAISALPPAGGTIYIPCGDFKGKITFPQYPKFVTIQGQGQCTILEEPTANSGLVSSSATVVNVTSGSNTIQNISVQPHNSSSTSIAFDMRGQNRGIYQHIWFSPASNGTGHFGKGFFCSTLTVNYAACFDNLVDDVTLLDQAGPTTVFETQGFAAQNTLSRLYILSLTGTTTIVLFNSPYNRWIDSDVEGNHNATLLNPGFQNYFEGIYAEDHKRVILGNGGGGNRFDRSIFGTGSTSTITCPGGESNWHFTNVQGVAFQSDLPGCQNARIETGATQDGLSPYTWNGGLTTSTLVGGSSLSVIKVTNTSPGLAAGTYTYNVAAVGSGGESLPATVTTTISGGEAPAQIILDFAGAGTSAAYNVYGRVCPTTATCKLLTTVVPQGNDGGGMFTDVGTLTPAGKSPETVRNSTQDINITGAVGGAGATAGMLYSSGPINYGTEGGVDNALVYVPQNGPAFTFQNWPFAPAFTICMYTSHSLQAGSNTVSVVGNVVNIRKGTDFTADLSTPIAANNIVCLQYNAVKNVFQYQGQ